MENETWKDIPGLVGRYQASNLGRIRSVDRFYTRKNGVTVFYKGRVLKQILNTCTGYFHVNIDAYPEAVHRLVAKAHLPLVEGKNRVNHINSCRSDNRLVNLEWCNQSENILHGYKYGNMRPTVKLGALNQNYKHGTTCKGLHEIGCAVCGTTFLPRIVRNRTCSKSCASTLAYKSRSSKAA